MSMNKVFNLIVSGYGGQGVLTLAEIISRAAIKQGYEVSESELHGLAQRGGSLDCHIRIFKRNSSRLAKAHVASPLIRQGGADLIISLDLLEAWRACYFANKKSTKIVANLELAPFKDKSFLNKNRIVSQIKKNTQKQEFIEATKIVKEAVGDITPLNIFMLSRALNKKYLPLKRETVWQVIKERLKARNLEANRKVWEI